MPLENHKSCSITFEKFTNYADDKLVLISFLVQSGRYIKNTFQSATTVSLALTLDILE